MKHNYQKLQIWEQGLEIAKDVYDYGEGLPDREKFGLWSQMTRASVSIASNIAEGASRSSDKGFDQFLRASIGSTCELETQLLICQHRQYGQHQLLEALLEKVDREKRMLIAFRRRLFVK